MMTIDCGHREGLSRDGELMSETTRRAQLARTRGGPKESPQRTPRYSPRARAAKAMEEFVAGRIHHAALDLEREFGGCIVHRGQRRAKAADDEQTRASCNR
jgi:hypothetical protein